MGEERQLSLLKGARQRGTVVRSQASEYEVHCAIADTLRASLARGWMWYHCPNGEERKDATAGRLHRMGVRPGVPDFTLISPTGEHYYLELKTKYGKMRPSQLEFLKQLATRGVECHVAWGYD